MWRKDGSFDSNMNPGPLRKPLSPANCGPREASCKTPQANAVVTGTVTYDSFFNGLQPLSGAKVRLMGNGNQFGPTVYTNAAGQFTVNWCPGPNMQVYAQVTTDNNDQSLTGWIQNQWTQVVGNGGPILTAQCNSNITFRTYFSEMSEAFDLAGRVISASRELLGPLREPRQNRHQTQSDIPAD